MYTPVSVRVYEPLWSLMTSKRRLWLGAPFLEGTAMTRPYPQMSVHGATAVPHEKETFLLLLCDK